MENKDKSRSTRLGAETQVEINNLVNEPEVAESNKDPIDLLKHLNLL